MRYLPHTDQDRADMLSRIGVGAIDDLFKDIPPDQLLPTPLELPRHKSELEVSRIMRGLASGNRAAGNGPFFVGAGAELTFVGDKEKELVVYRAFVEAA